MQLKHQLLIGRDVFYYSSEPVSGECLGFYWSPCVFCNRYTAISRSILPVNVHKPLTSVLSHSLQQCRCNYCTFYCTLVIWQLVFWRFQRHENAQTRHLKQSLIDQLSVKVSAVLMIISSFQKLKVITALAPKTHDQTICSSTRYLVG